MGYPHVLPPLPLHTIFFTSPPPLPPLPVPPPMQVRVRENAESIAFYRGEQREARLVRFRLARVVATIFARVRWEAYLSLWQNCYAYATILLPSLLLSKRYFAGEIRFGDIAQAGFAFRT